MDKLVNLKMTASEQKKQMAPIATQSDGDRYPYGLSIALDSDTIDKLDVDDDLTAGDTVVLLGKATVRSVSTSDSESGKSRTVSLQITDLCLETGEETDLGAVAARLYDGKGDGA